MAQRARSLRDHAQSQKYLHDEIGYNYRMDSFQAAVLAIKLERLDAWNTARADRAAYYNELLKNSSYKLPTHFPDSECVWHCYVIETPELDRVRAALQDAGVETGPFTVLCLFTCKRPMRISVTSRAISLSPKGSPGCEDSRSSNILST
jgi:dTDP-4-amino-4,6-dideoxygalactose transaminase